MNVYIFICVDKAGTRERADETELLAVVLKKKSTWYLSLIVSLPLCIFIYINLCTNK